MQLQTISTPDAPKAIGPYSQAVSADGFVFVSGQLGLDPETGNLVSEDVRSQAEQALKNLSAILLAAGTDLDHVVSVDVFLTDMADFQTLNAVYERFFVNHRPARAAIGVAALPKGAKIEIRCTAVRR
uniref:RidA family protein n=1 Tax=Desulfatirhabdium butyrativorans TaxID=340467 RepID=A0A7C4MMB7_9BACT